MHGHWQYFNAHTHKLKVKPSSCIFTSCQGVTLPARIRVIFALLVTTMETSLAWPDRFFPFLCGGGGKKGLAYYHYMTCAENRQILAIVN